MQKLRNWLSSLSYKTGIAFAVICALCYAISFAQMLLPVSVAVKGVLWIIFFGLAKTFQYSALLVFGKSGIMQLRRYFKRPGAIS